jgi:hypothetical protein
MRWQAECRYSEEAGVEDATLLKDAAGGGGSDPVESSQGDAQTAITEVRNSLQLCFRSGGLTIYKWNLS